ncbi:hypothetical protein C0991_006820 [Blastosporella zonata]|nr:hypothetical protein C0991_006820 [Blastosporella zonata]
MRFSTVAAVSTLMLAGFSVACKSDMDCPRGETCQFLSTKDSQGKCYKRNEGPAAAGVGPSATKKVGRKRALAESEELKVARREFVRAALNVVAARSLAELEYDELD